MRAALLAIAVLAAPCAADAPKKPNVLILLADDQRFDTIAALGNKNIDTPNYDRLVKGGTTFPRAYCMGAMQGAVCVPSRAMLMSGRTLFHINANLKDIPTWPEAFHKAGYATFLSGKWHNGEESALRSFENGKTVFFGGMGADPYKLPVQDFTAEHTLTPKRDSGKHSVELFADSAIDFIKDRKDDRPFLCYVAWNAPHDPRIAPKEYHDRYNANKPPLPPNFLPEHPFNNGDLIGRDERLAPWPRTPEVVRQNLADYYASISWVDHQIGRVLDALKESGQYDNTIILVSSDHGLAIGSHGLMGKQNLYDHSMHVPLIMAGPGVPKGETRDALIYLLDVFPTLGDLAGVKGPDGSEGKSLTGVLAGKESGVRDSLFTAYTKVQRAVRDDRWKLIVYPQINKTQLFDLKDDPAETKDLSGDPAHAAEVARLTALLKDWQKKMDDKQPLTTDKPQPAEFDFSKVPPVKPPAKPPDKGMAGFWQGALKVGAVELRLVLNVTAKEDGGLIATLDSPDQGAKGIPVEEVGVKDTNVKLELKKIKASFEGTLSDDGQEIVGTWKQGGTDFPLTFKRLDKAPDYGRPQDPKKPYPYAEEEVTFENKPAGVKFAGTLTIPKGKGPFPAAVLLSGSGKHDRDESLMGHRPFLVLADHLTRNGIAVLRCDDRGVGGSTGDKKAATEEDLADDALAAVAFLKGRAEIDPKKIGLIGHSNGGVIAPIAAAKSGDVAFIVLLAGPSLPGEEILYRQGELIARAGGADDKAVARQRAIQEKMFAILKKEKDDKKAREQIEAAIQEEAGNLSDDEKKEAEKQKGLIEAQMKMVMTPWFRFFLTYDPAPTLRKVKCPVLALNGERDLQVPAKADLDAIKEALKEGGNKDFTVKELPKLNHLFQTCETGAPTEYGKIDETMAPAALDEISGWIVKRFGAP